MFALKASISKTSDNSSVDGNATTKLLYVDPVFNVNGFESSVNVLFVDNLTSPLVVGIELVEP